MPRRRKEDKKIPNIFRAWSFRFGHAVYLHGRKAGVYNQYLRKYLTDEGERTVFGTMGMVGYSHMNYAAARGKALRVDGYCEMEDAEIYDIDRMYYGLAHWKDRPEIMKINRKTERIIRSSDYDYREKSKTLR